MLDTLRSGSMKASSLLLERWYSRHLRESQLSAGEQGERPCVWGLLQQRDHHTASTASTGEQPQAPQSQLVQGLRRDQAGHLRAAVAAAMLFS